MITFDGEANQLTQLFTEVAKFETKGRLGEALAAYVETISVYDLAMIGASIESETFKLSPSYGKALKPYMREKLFGGHQRMLAMRSDGSLGKMTDGIRDLDEFKKFCGAMVNARSVFNPPGEEYGRFAIAAAALYVVTGCFSIFVLDQPGHPVGMPFPGGFKSYVKDGLHYCPSRDKAKDIEYAFCNFCPSRPASLMK